MQVGSVTHTEVAIMYLNGTAKQEIIDEVRRRLQNIDYESILESGYIENLIEEQTYTPFPTLFNTERPDTVAAHILEGRIAVFVDGTPFALVAPTTFFMFFQSAEDYYHRTDVSSGIRLLRYISLFISMFGPSIYIASITFHQEMIPTPLLLSLASQRESVPFPALVEALIMEVSFEILREAGIRMPRAIGQAVSIVGALVLGQAAVQAGIVSSAMVIVVALTGISSFTTPSFNAALSIRLLRFAVMFCSAFLGFFGIAMFSILMIAHMCGLRSFGEPYLSPLTPLRGNELKDTFVRRAFKRSSSNRRPN
jgi:spore germination protein KA